jgi:uncharacterized protein (TIGR00299 family) protein
LARTVYFDCFSGASGDMVLGALLDLGLPLDGLRAALGSLAVDVGAIAAERVIRAGVAATKFRAEAADDDEQHDHLQNDHGHQHHHGQGRAHRHPHHSLKEIRALIERSALSPRGKDRAIGMFQRLAEAEAQVHAIPVEQVHLHEVGALDSIVDIVGAVYGMEWLGADEIVASPLNVGSGTVECAHGTFPVPAPATALLLRGVPIQAGPVAAEMVTPTGALLVTEYASAFGPLPAMRVEAIGYGAGHRDFTTFPNVLRILQGESTGAGAREPIVVVECEIDDMNPQLFGPLMDRLFEAGALDVFYSAVQMKKNRPGVLVTVLTPPAHRESIASLLFTETTTIGVRFQDVVRERLAREIQQVDTPIGPIRFKVARRDGRVLNAAPEFDDCAAVAAARKMSIKDVQAIAMKAWLEQGEQQRA